jgi:hypothetical protein
LHVGYQGKWVKLADIDHVVDITDGQIDGLQNGDGDSLMAGTDNQSDAVAHDFVLPPYSGFVYKYAP